jgi:trk system potassium uptake protein TrkA
MMRVIVVGAGQVGSTVIEALHEEHEVTLVDVDATRLNTFGHRYDLITVEGNSASRRTLRQANIEEADLLIACTSRDG